MSWIRSIRAEYFTHEGPNRRTVVAIRNKAAGKGERNIASRLIHKKDDKDEIAGWKQDLIGILQIFNVRSVRPARRLLRVSSLDGAVNK